MDYSRFIGRLSDLLTRAAGSYWAVIVSIVLNLILTATGFIFHWSDIYILIWNQFISVASFILLFIIQHSSNKDTSSLHKKIDELIRAIDGTDESLIESEKLPE